MYVGNGNTGSPTAHVFRSDDVTTGVPVFTDLTAAESPAGQTDNYCSGQCWYDNFVVTPAGNPDMVYIGGSLRLCDVRDRDKRPRRSSLDRCWSVVHRHDVGIRRRRRHRREAAANLIQLRRMECILTSMRFVVSPSNPGLFFDGSDGGLVRSDGAFTDISSQCTNVRGLSGDDLALCQQLLSQVPKHLYSLNKGTFDHSVPECFGCCRRRHSTCKGGRRTTEPSKPTGAAALWPQDYLRRRWPVGFQRRQLRAALQHLLRKLHGCEFPERRSEQVGRYLRPAVCRDLGILQADHRGSSSLPGRSSWASRACGGRRIGAATRRIWRRIALSSPPRGRTRSAVTSS